MIIIIIIHNNIQSRKIVKYNANIGGTDSIGMGSKSLK
jgi:hypothetical protein